MKKVITYGSFDLFHKGHYKLLEKAKALGDYLIVGITTVQYDESRGKLNVVDSIVERIENVKKTGFADEIIVEDHAGQKVEDIQKYGVDILVADWNWSGTFDYVKDYCEVVYFERNRDLASMPYGNQKYPIIKMGVVGTGRIAGRFVLESKFVSGIEMTSVYNPHRESTEKFAERFKLKGFWEEYDAFLDSVDTVYVASVHQTHYEYAKRALSRGKHVLCEKPMAMSKAQAQDLFATAKEHDCLLLEAIKTAYCPGFRQLLEVVESGIIGDVVDVEACFTRIADPNLRERIDVNYGGGFLEFGSHTMLPIFKLMGTEYKDVRFDSIKDKNGIDQYTKVYFSFEKGMALSRSGVAVKSEGQLILAGTKGYILAESPWWLTKHFEVRFEDFYKKEVYNTKFLGDGLRYEMSEFISLIYKGERQSDKFTKEESIAMAGVVEKFMEMRK